LVIFPEHKIPGVGALLAAPHRHQAKEKEQKSKK
jgi:hypothetical protein